MPENLLAAAVSLVAAYLLGSLPSAQLFARMGGKDIFSTGSGNMGTMNALRNLGPVYGIMTFILDVLKGVAAVLLAPVLAGIVAGGSEFAADWAVAAAVFGAGLGHVFPVFTRFRGGKALAVAFGAILPLNWPVAVAAVVLIALLVLVLKNVSLASAVTIAVAGAVIIVLDLLQSGDAGAVIRSAGVLLLVILIVWRHAPFTASGRNPLVAGP